MENAKYRILLIEDDKLDQTAFKRLVEEEKLPYDYTIAGSVSQAQSILRSERFDTVISDYMLGDGTAFDILHLVKNTPTILVTATGDEEVVVKAWKAGADDYLIKDLERNYLKAVPITIENVITHRKMEEELRLLSGAVMSANDSVYITDRDDKIIFVNRAFCETYGYTKEYILGKDSNILWTGKPQSENTRSVFQITQETWEAGFYHKRKDGSVFPVSLSISIIKDCGGNEVAAVAIARDVSERIRIEDELRAANQELEKQNQLKNELAVVISEKLKAPLTALRNIIRDAKAAATSGKISPALQENLELAEKDIDQLKRIVSDFLDISSIDTGSMKLELAELSLGPVISEVVEALSSLASEKGVELNSSIPDSELVVNVDHNRMTQILSSLIKNSIESTPSDGHVSVQVKDTGDAVAVEVQDDGPIIESGKINEIFNRFARIKELVCPGKEEDPAPAPLENQSKPSGALGSESFPAGLGLPIAKELVEMHSGCLWAETRGEQGNNFCFSLPKAGIEKEAVCGTVTRQEK